jgi:hypothetical protein
MWRTYSDLDQEGGEGIKELKRMTTVMNKKQLE